MKTLAQVQKEVNGIFWRQVGKDQEFRLLHDFNGNTFTNLQAAITFVRVAMEGLQVELADFEQAQLDNGMWDNL